MKMQEVLSQFRQHQKYNLKQKSITSYRYLLDGFEEKFGECSLESVGPDEIFEFLEHLTQDLSKSTRRLRYAQLKAFYNFTIEKCAADFKNPLQLSSSVQSLQGAPAGRKEDSGQRGR